MLQSQFVESQTSLSLSAASVATPSSAVPRLLQQEAGVHIHARPPVITALSDASAPDRAELENFCPPCVQACAWGRYQVFHASVDEFAQ